MASHGVRNFLEIQAKLLGLHDELFHFLLQKHATLGGRRRGQFGNNRAEAGAHLDQTFGDELRNNFVRRVGVDLEGFAQSANRREGVAGAHLPRDDGLFRGVDHLFVE